MSAKDNFSKAAYELFGVGSEGTEMNDVQDMSESPISAGRTISEPQGKEMQSFIAPGSVFEGTLRTNGNVEVSGEFKGDIIAGGLVVLHSNHTGNVTANELKLSGCTLTGDLNIKKKLIVGQESVVNGNVTVQDFDCAGVINGDIEAENYIDFKSTAVVCGNVKSVTISMDRGARIRGSIEMSDARE